MERDGEVLCGSEDGIMSLHDVASGKLIAKSSDFGDSILCMALVKVASPPTPKLSILETIYSAWPYNPNTPETPHSLQDAISNRFKFQILTP